MVKGEIDEEERERTRKKGGKLVFDPEHLEYRREGNVLALERISRRFQKQAAIKNRSADLDMAFCKSQASREHHIFDARLHRELTERKTTLRDLVAHRRVLDRIAQGNSYLPPQRRDPATGNVIRAGFNANLGAYGPGTSYFTILPRIDTEKRQMSASFRRRQRTEKLLAKREPMELIDRTLDTQSILQQWRRWPCRSAVKQPGASRPSKRTVRVRLPPLSGQVEDDDDDESTSSSPALQATPSSSKQLSPSLSQRGIRHSAPGTNDHDQRQEDSREHQEAVFITQRGRLV